MSDRFQVTRLDTSTIMAEVVPFLVLRSFTYEELVGGVSLSQPIKEAPVAVMAQWPNPHHTAIGTTRINARPEEGCGVTHCVRRAVSPPADQVLCAPTASLDFAQTSIDRAKGSWRVTAYRANTFGRLVLHLKLVLSGVMRTAVNAARPSSILQHFTGGENQWACIRLPRWTALRARW